MTTNYDKLYIGGAWVEPAAASGALEVIDSTTEAVFATVPEGTPADIDRAVAAARAAFDGWAEEPVAERSKLLRRVAEELEARRDEIAEVITHEVGMPRPQSAAIQVGTGISAFSIASELVTTFPFEDTDNGLVVREPIGVVGAITPWNYPLNQIGAKVAYALAAGCTVVLKPSEVAPVNAFILAEIIDEVGFPAGAFNLVTGLGPVVGEALAAHPDVDMISFTGSTRAGKRVAELAAQSVKRVALELGGKSPNVILDDADFPAAVAAGVGAAYANSGQTCSALTRMIVPRSRLAEVEEIARTTAESYTVGDPFADGTRLGPLISAVQLERVRGYIQKGIDEGATLVTGGPEAPDGLDTGYFVRPTVFSDVSRDMTIAQEEIFGPVLSILPYDTEEEAIEIANDTVYGLAGAVSGSDERARRVARRIRAGQVRVNSGRGGGGAPFGGYKQSGLGREHGAYGLEEFLEVKALFV
jgi:acyl-CoA reductase-like NAD-dependent aldehyde dehydrogenase